MQKLQHVSCDVFRPLYWHTYPLNKLRYRSPTLVIVKSTPNSPPPLNPFTGAALGASLLLLSAPTPALADKFPQPPPPNPQTTVETIRPLNLPRESDVKQAPTVTSTPEYQYPEGNVWRYSDFMRIVQDRKVELVRFNRDGRILQLITFDGRRAQVTVPNDPNLVEILANNGVDISIAEGDQTGGILSVLGSVFFPVIVFVGLFLLLRRTQGGREGGGLGPMGGFGAMDFGRSRNKFQEVPETGISFDDVAGCDGAKLELQEIVDFLKSPDKYTKLGAKIPKGALLVGPPGTGKTLLAKAVAGEAGVPFFSCAASEFVELFVGVGASRVRDLFDKAKKKAPCILFIDELDAVGRQRGTGLGGGNDEREQTINQLLSELDGFEGNKGVIVLAATNRPDILDAALLRPGRFDRQITVDRPDVQGRIAILKVHCKGKTVGKDVDLEKIARRTPGFTGADLQNLMNEAAIMAARRNLTEISNDEISDALERIVAGPEKKDSVMTDKKKTLVAYHEVGHALVGALMPDYDPVTKISIVPRGPAGGITFFAPSEERLELGMYTYKYLVNQMAVALGGRIAEELVFGEDDITTGASNDFMQVTRTARMLVTQAGLNRRIGQLSLARGPGPTFLGQEMATAPDHSSATSDIVDEEVKKLVEQAYRRAKDLIQSNIEILHKAAQILIEKESMDGDEFQQLVMEAGANQYLKEDAPEVSIPYQTV